MRRAPAPLASSSCIACTAHDALRARFSAFDDGIDEPERPRLLRADRLGRENQVEAPLHADQPRQALRAARARNDAQGDFRQAQPRVGSGQPIVTGQRQFQPTAEHGAVHGHHHGNALILEASPERAVFGFLGGAGEFADIRTGKIGLARTSQQHRAGLGATFDLVERGVEIGAHARRDGIDRRIVGGDHGDAIAARESDGPRHD